MKQQLKWKILSVMQKTKMKADKYTKNVESGGKATNIFFPLSPLKFLKSSFGFLTDMGETDDQRTV